MAARWPAGIGVVMIALAWLAVAPPPAYGCSCALVPLADYASDIELAFIGRLTDRTEHSNTADNGVSLAFDVERVYKGPVEARVEVFTHAQTSACGLDVGGRVGIVASTWQGKLNVHSCSSPVAQSELEAVFGPGAEPAGAAAGGRPWGPIGLVAVAGAAAALGVVLAVGRWRASERSGQSGE